jgi:hypothetical protein
MLARMPSYLHQTITTTILNKLAFASAETNSMAAITAQNPCKRHTISTPSEIVCRLPSITIIRILQVVIYRLWSHAI